MRKYCVYVSTGYADGSEHPPDSIFVAFPDDTPEKVIEKVCEEALALVLANRGSGWYELDADEADEADETYTPPTTNEDQDVS